jgi:secondary thiamine-phosphate synthase enzyme
MAVVQTEIEIATDGAGLCDITDSVAREVRRSGIRSGVVTVFCQHTSCSLVFMENASPDARRDLERFLDRLVPATAAYEHAAEGPDDMPSHIKMALTRTSESIPFADARLRLGTWQGLYLWEHRSARHHRSVALTIIGE